MNWINLKDQLPPMGSLVLFALNNSFYVGQLDSSKELQLRGYSFTGIPTATIYWAIIPDSPKAAL